MIINKIMIKNKEADVETSVLGISGENEQEKLIFSFEDSFIDGTCFLDLEFPSGKKKSIELQKEDETYILEVKSSLLTEIGDIIMQLKIICGSSIWKSIIFKMNVLNAINASETIEEQYPCFTDWIKRRVQELEIGLKQIEKNVNEFGETDPTVPSHVKQITEEDINAWNNKSDFSGDYEDLVNKPEIPSVEGLASEEFVEEKIGELPRNNFEEMASVDVSNLVEEYTITVTNGKFISPEWAVGKTSIVVKKRQEVTIEADEGLNGWQDGENKVCNNATYHFFVIKDMSLTAVNLEEQTLIFWATGKLYKNPYKIDFFLNWDIPTEYTIESSKLIYSYLKNGETIVKEEAITCEGNYKSAYRVPKPFTKFSGYTINCKFEMNLTNANNESVVIESEIMTFTFVEKQSKLAGEGALLETYNKLNTKIENTELDTDDNIKQIEQKAGRMKIESMTESEATILPNVYYKWEEVAELNITLGEEQADGYTNEYCFEFKSGETATTLIIDESIKWVSEPSIEANKTYQVSILNGIGVIAGA